MNTLILRSVSTATLLISVANAAYAQDSDIMDEIIVTGSPLTRSVDEAITGVSVLSGEELSNRLAGTIGETLKSEPGVSSTFFGAGASRPIIRGQGGDRVRILTNGIGSIDASSASPDHAVAAEPAQAERIEVLRGASLLRYGSSGSGGIINVIDGRIPNKRPDGDISGALRIGASSVDLGREVSASIDKAIGNNVVVHTDGTFKQSDSFDGPDGRISNSAVKTSSVTGGVSYIGNKGFLGGALHSFKSDYEVPGDPDEAVSIVLTQTRFDLNGKLDMDGFIEKLQIFGGYADYTHTEFEAPGEPGTVFTNEGYEVRVEAIQREQKGWAAAYGVQLRQRDFAAIGEEAFVPPTNTQQIGLYTFQEKEIGNFHLEGAVRYENTKQQNSVTSQDIGFNLLSVSAGSDVHLTDAIRFGGTVFRTQRAPTTEELFSNGPHLATDQFEVGDPSLAKETATGVEAAFRVREDGHYLTVNAFYTDYSNYIFERETGAEEDGLDVFQFTGEDASFRGFEVQGGMDVAEIGNFTLKADALAEYVRAKTDSGNLPRIPPLSVLAGIEADSERFNFRAEVDYAAAQNKVETFETPTDDYALVNVFATWRAPTDAQDVRLSVSVLNLLDDDARQHTSFLKDVVPLPGRNVRFSIASSF